MRKMTLIFFIVFGTLIGCKNSKNEITETQIINSCGVKYFKDLSWAQNLISGKGSCVNLYEGAKLIMYDYNGSKVFHLTNNLSSLSTCSEVVFNCSGEMLVNFFPSTQARIDFENNRRNGKLLWKK